jgi:hypothetical protein
MGELFFAVVSIDRRLRWTRGRGIWGEEMGTAGNGKEAGGGQRTWVRRNYSQ